MHLCSMTTMSRLLALLLNQYFGCKWSHKDVAVWIKMWPVAHQQLLRSIISVDVGGDPVLKENLVRRSCRSGVFDLSLKVCTAHVVSPFL